MAASGVICGNWLSRMQLKGSKERKHKRVQICCSSLTDSYKTLRIQPGASQSEVKRLSGSLLSRGTKCGVQFHQINEAYDIVMANLRGESNATQVYECYDAGIDEHEPMRGMDDPDWDLWEEWMGWEGAGIRDYSSHINPYI
ncbi:Chaperone protein dnaJ 8 [Spatholobus suberectus]|nr:Chaperone protein dnaJ 8 [Spatholobus suberectus]